MRIIPKQDIVDIIHAMHFDNQNAYSTFKKQKPVQLLIDVSNEKMRTKITNFKLADNSVYTGYINKSKELEGHGALIEPTGAIYQGEFYKNMKHGQGVYINKKGDLIKGQWESDNQVGNGTCVFKNNIEYTGDMLNCKPNGKG